MYRLQEIREEFEKGDLKNALLKFRLFALERDLKFPFRWASLELYGYTEYLDEGDETLPWWRDCQVVWIGHDDKVIGTEYDPGRDQAWVYTGVKDIEEQGKSRLPPGEFAIPPPEGKEDSVKFGMVQIRPLYNRIREAGLHILIDVERVLNDRSSAGAKEETFSIEDAEREIIGFKNFVERQAHRDIFINGHPQESIARSLLQAYLLPRSYREVPVRGGRTDILLMSKTGRFLYEAKIWRGRDYYDQGLREIEEYVIGEGDAPDLIGIFYVVFDPTKSQSASAYLGGHLTAAQVCGRQINVIVIDLALPQPSKKGKPQGGAS